MPIENDLPACPHCHVQPALVSKQTRRCTHCNGHLDRKPTPKVGKGVIQRNLREPNQLAFAFCLPAVIH